MHSNKSDEVLLELKSIAREAFTTFYASQQIQKGIGVYPIVKKLHRKANSTEPRLEDIKLKINKKPNQEYLTANATGKIQWRAEFIIEAILKIMKKLELDSDGSHISSLESDIKHLQTKDPIHFYSNKENKNNEK
jgi:hypothetical protein